MRVRRGRGRVHVPPDLTSLFDVLFIVVFAALIRAVAAQAAAAHPSPPAPAHPSPLPPPAPVARLQARALAELREDLAGRTPLVVRVSERGTIEALETNTQRIPLDAPLLEASTDPDVAVAYLGDRSAELRVCRLAALHLNAAELSKYLVIIAPARAPADLPHALYDGLHRDVDRCAAEQRGLAVIVDPTAP